MTVAIPTEQQVDAQQLEADAYMHLYEIDLYPTGVLYLCPEQAITWQGQNYQFWGMTLTGVGLSSDDQATRPQMSLANFTNATDGTPIRGVFSALQAQDKIEGATVIRRKVLRTHALANQNIVQVNKWKVAKIAKLTLDVVTLELRNSLDGPVFTMPARKYMPPDFPQVSLS